MLTITNYTDSVDTPNATFRRYAYGYGIWLAKAPFYFGHGTDGQTLTIIPDKETVIITLAEQSDMETIERLINYIITEKSDLRAHFPVFNTLKTDIINSTLQEKMLILN